MQMQKEGGKLMAAKRKRGGHAADTLVGSIDFLLRRNSESIPVGITLEVTNIRLHGGCVVCEGV